MSPCCCFSISQLSRTPWAFRASITFVFRLIGSRHRHRLSLTFARFLQSCTNSAKVAQNCNFPVLGQFSRFLRFSAKQGIFMDFADFPSSEEIPWNSGIFYQNLRVRRAKNDELPMKKQNIAIQNKYFKFVNHCLQTLSIFIFICPWNFEFRAAQRCVHLADLEKWCKNASFLALVAL